MGVKGLWRLLLPIGRRISIETLEGQVLAIDASIWLTQFLTVAARQREQDLMGEGSYPNNDNNGNNGKAYSYDYLVGFLRRLCKLRYQGVRPVLVFDGETPEIKKRELRDRMRRRKRKLGESFYLGDQHNKTGDTAEDEEMMEATRRMAKRILAKQLRTGQLLTVKQKQTLKHKHKKVKTLKNPPNTNTNTTTATTTSNATTVASASYAPGFYDPDAAVVEAKQQSPRGPLGTTKDKKNKCDDDHLLQDDYNTNPLQEEINDWDRPIVINSDDENDNNNSNSSQNSSTKPKKSNSSKGSFGFGSASKFHAGDGTNFKVESVADLDDSARKDVIEDARKHRRLASRREFMKVASDPDGLSSCQLRNFLKSTKLNRDIAKMARATKARAEEEAKMIAGNGILFEKDDDTISRNITNATTIMSYRQQYRSGAAYHGTRITVGKKSNSGMMRMFHHKDQTQTSKGNTGGNDGDGDGDGNGDDDEHDFRKARNNHYLAGGIRFVNSDEEKEEDYDSEEHLDDKRDTGRSRHRKTALMAAPLDHDGGGGFVVSVTDGSDRPRKNPMGNAATVSNNGGGEIIEIDISSSDSDSSSSSSSERDDNHFEDDRKPRALTPKCKNSKASQELQDEALARALQTIEEEEITIEEAGTNPGSEAIQIDNSENAIYPSNGFFQHPATSKEPKPGDERSQKTRDDANLARTLQEAEYDEDEVQDDGGGFVKTKQGSIDEQESVGDDGGFLATTKEDLSGSEGISGDVGGFLGATESDSNDQAENADDGGGFLISTEGDSIYTGKSQCPPSSYNGDERKESNVKIVGKGASLPAEEWNPFAENHSVSDVSNSIFAMSNQREASKKQSERNIHVCHDSSEDEEEEDIDWEDGNSDSDIKNHGQEHSRQNNSDAGVAKRRVCTSLERVTLPTLSQSDIKNTVHVDNSDDSGDYEDREEANKEAVDLDVINAAKGNMSEDEALELPKKNTETTSANTKEVDENNVDVVNDDEVDWEDGDEEANEIKPAGIDISAGENVVGITKRSELNEIEESNDSGDDNGDWEEGDNETDEGSKEIIDISSGKEGAERSAKNTSYSTDTDTKEAEVNWEDSLNRINENKPEVINLCEEKKVDNSVKILLSKEAIDDDNDDDDEVDWEDGDDEPNQSNPEVIDLCEEREIAKPLRQHVLNSVDACAKEIHGNGNGKGKLEGEDKPKITSKSTEEVDGASGKSKKNPVDQKIEEAIGRRHIKETSKYFDTATKSLSKVKVIELDGSSNDDDSIEWKAGEGHTMIDADDWGTTKNQSSDEVAAALEHAQGTAANLTDWAGRAFRRAVAQHAIENGMVVPESAKPGVLKNTRSDMDRDEPAFDQSKTVVRSAQRTSQESMQTRKHDSLDRKTSNDKIDNSGWLHTVDTTNTNAEDYTVAPQEVNPSDRLLDGATGGITEEMRTEVMQLLRLFGIPYVVAPAEAEAQCVELERLGLVDGIVTEDSDTFVFGGQVIYKNIFDDKKYVEVYHTKDASEEMNLTQDSLVALAMLLGGDYTEGVNGVGIVNGMEVLQAFDVAQDCEAGLKRFRKWLDGFDPNDLTTNIKNGKNVDDREMQSEKEKLFHRKHHTARTRWIAPKHFPDVKVLNAYLNPVVDTSTERFSWGIPDLNGLIAFCHGHMGWVADETEKMIGPIIQRMEEGSMRQTRIDSFMRYEDGIKFAKIQSKRLRQVLGLSSKDTTAGERPRRKRVHAMAPTSWNEDEKYGTSGEFSEPECLFKESGKTFASIDAASTTIYDTTIREPLRKDDKTNQPQPPKKVYNGKRTRSLAVLSSASASTVAIASSSKSDDVPGSTSTGGALVSVAHRRFNSTKLPRKAPPSYQKQSSAILEEQKSNTTDPLDDTKSNTYKVINPSMI